MKLKVLFSIILFSICSVNAQYNLAWDSLIDNTGSSIESISDYGVNMIKLSTDSGIFTAGISDNGISTDLICCKLDLNGNTKWKKTFDFGLNLNDAATSIIIDKNNNLLIAGYSQKSANDYDYLVLKYSPTGILINQYTWSSLINNNLDNAKDIKIDNSGAIYICGVNYVNGGNYSYTTIKLSPNLVFSWQYTYNGGSHDYGYPNHIAIDSSCYVYMTGQYYNTLNSSDDGALVKIDSSGNQKWVRTYGGIHNSGDYYYDLNIDKDGNPIVCGDEDQQITDNFLTIKYDSSGNMIFSDTYLSTPNIFQTARAISTDYAGNIFVSGESFNLGVSSILSLKYSPSGVMLWDRVFAKSTNIYNVAMDNFIDRNGNLFITGYTFGIDYDVINLSYDNSGTLAWDTTYSFVSDDGGNSIVTDSLGNIYVFGTSYYDFQRKTDLMVLKYSPLTLSVSESKNTPFTVFPNPASNKITVSGIDEVKITIFNSMGKLMYSSFTKKKSFDVSELQSGIYLLMINGKNWTKFIKD